MSLDIRWLTLIAVGVGGSLGAISRYLITCWMSANGMSQPIATLLINVVGSGLLGVIAGLGTHHIALSDIQRGTLVVGFLSGLTTFSTFSFEVFAIAELQSVLLAGAYALASVTLSLLSFGAALYLIK